MYSSFSAGGMLPLYIEGVDIEPIPIKSKQSGNEHPSVRISWENVKVDDARTLIGYQVLYKES